MQPRWSDCFVVRDFILWLPSFPHGLHFYDVNPQNNGLIVSKFVEFMLLKCCCFFLIFYEHCFCEEGSNLLIPLIVCPQVHTHRHTHRKAHEYIIGIEIQKKRP